MAVFSGRPPAGRQGRAHRGVAAFLPFLITLAIGAIVVAVVALSIGGHSTARQTTIPLPAPAPSATPAPNVSP